MTASKNKNYNCHICGKRFDAYNDMHYELETVINKYFNSYFFDSYKCAAVMFGNGVIDDLLGMTGEEYSLTQNFFTSRTIAIGDKSNLIYYSHTYRVQGMEPPILK